MVIRMMKDRNSMHRWFVPNAPVAMVSLLAFLVLLPFGGLYNIPLLVLCGLGLWCLGTSPREILSDDGLRLLLLVFLCVWLPMAIAAVDAVNPVESWRKAASFPVFFLAGTYVVRATSVPTIIRTKSIG